MVAKRMGWEGKVVLSVEVLASGSPGQISVRQSSGHEVLDKTALQAVRGWRFVPARHNGQAIAKEFLVPIPFVLKETE
jgi:protein TonB